MTQTTKFVVLSIYKTSGNVPSICQRHYTQVLINERGFELC